MLQWSSHSQNLFCHIFGQEFEAEMKLSGLSWLSCEGSKRVISPLQAGRSTRYPATIETPVGNCWSVSSCLSPGRVKKLQNFINFWLKVGHSANLKHSKSTWRQSSCDSCEMYKISTSRSRNGNNIRQLSFWLVPHATRNQQNSSRDHSERFAWSCDFPYFQ